MAVQQTSFLAFQEVQPRIGRMQQKVLSIIINNPGIDNLMIAEMLKIPINTYCSVITTRRLGMPTGLALTVERSIGLISLIKIQTVVSQVVVDDRDIAKYRSSLFIDRDDSDDGPVTIAIR